MYSLLCFLLTKCLKWPHDGEVSIRPKILMS